MIIDPPSFFSQITDWQAFLEDMLKALENDFDNDDAHDWVEVARQRIAELSTDSV